MKILASYRSNEMLIVLEGPVEVTQLMRDPERVQVFASYYLQALQTLGVESVEAWSEKVREEQALAIAEANCEAEEVEAVASGLDREMH